MRGYLQVACFCKGWSMRWARSKNKNQWKEARSRWCHVCSNAKMSRCFVSLERTVSSTKCLAVSSCWNVSFCSKSGWSFVSLELFRVVGKYRSDPKTSHCFVLLERIVLSQKRLIFRLVGKYRSVHKTSRCFVLLERIHLSQKLFRLVGKYRSVPKASEASSR